jgi:uncharacterized phage protein gp47/JayE
VTTYPLATLAAQVTGTGISAPVYADDLASLQASFRGIFGNDVYIETDSQDGQWLAILAQAVNDTNALAIAVYNAFSPSTAQGVGLSTVVKINGLKRALSNNSTVDIVSTGDPGSVINGGVVQDALGNKYSLKTFIIPPGGSITATATALKPGPIGGAPGTVNVISTPTRGWLTVTNPNAVSPGNAVETDAELRQRQSVSTGNGAVAPLKTLTGNIETLAGVTEVIPYENVSNITDANGLPGHSISMVVTGGDVDEIASVILNLKTEGASTYGTTSVMVPDYAGVTQTINFFRPTLVTIQVQVTLTPLAGFSTATEALIQNAVAAYINALAGGDDIILSKIYVPANLNNDLDGQTFDITGLLIGSNGGSLAASDIVIAFNEEATCIAADVTFVT